MNKNMERDSDLKRISNIFKIVLNKNLKKSMKKESPSQPCFCVCNFAKICNIYIVILQSVNYLEVLHPMFRHSTIFLPSKIA